MARKRTSVFPVLMLAIGLAAGWWIARHGLPMLNAPSSQPVEKSTSPATGSGAGIRAVDFRNFRYTPDCLRGSDGKQESVQVQKGGFARMNEADTLDFTVVSVGYGDLTGDGHDEAVVLTACSTGGTGNFTEGSVFGMRDGQAVELHRVEAGSKAFGGLVSLKIKQNRLLVERYATDEDGAHCCPKYIDTTSLRWKNGRLVEDGASVRRDAPSE